MDLKNFRQLYCCCGCSLQIGCILIAVIEICYPILLTCSPANEPEIVIGISWLLYISASIMLLYGTIKETPIILLAWIIFRAVVMFLTFAGFIYKISEIYEKSEQKAKLIMFFLISMVFYFAVNGYFWTVVYSHYMELKEKARRQNKGVTPVV